MAHTQRTTAGDQLERILYILPTAARDGGARVDDLARELNVTPARVLADLEEATARAYHHPGASIEPFTILIDGRSIEVFAHHDFTRPVRLNAREALALGLGLRTLAAETEPQRRDEVLQLAERLEVALCAPDSLPGDSGQTDGVEYDGPGMHFELGDDGFRGAIADAVARGTICDVSYLKAGGVEPEPRRIAPYRLVYADGRWYVAALDVAREGLRFFRMDRVLAAAATAEAAPPPPDHLDAWLRGAPYIGVDEIDVTVRYAPEIARWIAERGGEPAARLDADGSAVVRHRVADVRWIVRHVLQYGGAAVVEAPAEARAWVRTAAARLADGTG
jgi:predicted DNA-binding transcriptional regulator YafY